jgi:hypothetical protein
MVEALLAIWVAARRHRTRWRRAKFAVANERILLARQQRGLHP